MGPGDMTAMKSTQQTRPLSPGFDGIAMDLEVRNSVLLQKFQQDFRHLARTRDGVDIPLLAPFWDLEAQLPNRLPGIRLFVVQELLHRTDIFLAGLFQVPEDIIDRIPWDHRRVPDQSDWERLVGFPWEQRTAYEGIVDGVPSSVERMAMVATNLHGSIPSQVQQLMDYLNASRAFLIGTVGE